MKTQKFSTGAVRERPEGKGRYDLLSPFVLRRLAIIFEEGTQKYAERNWEQGIPFSRVLDSALRHLVQYLEGRDDEDHLARCVWNLCALLHYDEAIKLGLLPEDLNDLPLYLKRKKNGK